MSRHQNGIRALHGGKRDNHGGRAAGQHVVLNRYVRTVHGINDAPELLLCPRSQRGKIRTVCIHPEEGWKAWRFDDVHKQHVGVP